VEPRKRAKIKGESLFSINLKNVELAEGRNVGLLNKKKGKEGRKERNGNGRSIQKKCREMSGLELPILL
jgi:hypothetical protein